MHAQKQPQEYSSIPQRKGSINTDDGVQIAWQAIGQGPPIICCNGVGVSTFFWKYICQYFGSQYTIILWDYRGHGESQRKFTPGMPDLSIERHVKDLQQVCTHLIPENSPAILLGHSMGCQVCIEFQRTYPQLVKAMVLMLGTAGKALETFANQKSSVHIFRVIKKVMNTIGPRANNVTSRLLKSRLAWPFTQKLALVDPIYTKKEDFLPYLTHLASMDILLFLEAAWQCQRHDAWTHLPHIAIPTLLIAAEKDTFTPVDCTQKQASSIPDAEILVLADGSHAAIVEQPETINYRLERFFVERLASLNAF